jgi:CubicO group peptidase (beta-lactamase class C family)
MVNTDILEGFRTAAIEKRLGVYGIHLYREGKGSVECRLRSNEREHLFSGSKAFTSMAAGIAAAEDLLSLSDSALSFFPQFEACAAQGAGDITVKDLLQMRAGHAASLFTTDERSQERIRDWAGVFFSTPQAHPAGEVFLYDNGCSYMLSRIIEAVSGVTLRDYLMPCLFEPLDIYNPQWHTCPGGHSLGAVGLYLNTEEFARLGILMLHGGWWEDRQIVPQAYIRLAAGDTVAAEGFDDPENLQGYGYQLWRCTVPGAYRADGKYGQYSIVLPDRGAVITVTAHNEENANDILRAVWYEVLPRL